MNLNQIDLNLLVVLKKLLQEKHVSNTALLLNMSQSSVSRALNKLRKLFNDPLLVKGASGYVLTPKAVYISDELYSVLTSLEKLLEGDQFCPLTSDRTIRFFGLTPNVENLLPSLIKMMRQDAPNMTLDIDTVSKPHFSGLISGEHHFVISSSEPLTSDQDLYRQHFISRDFRLIMSKSHPLAEKELTSENLRNCQFGQISLYGDKKLSIESQFKKLGITGDNGKISTPVLLNNFSAAASLAENSDLIFHLPTSYALQQKQYHQIVCKKVPKNLQHPTIKLFLYWHKRYHLDPMCVWFRSEFIKLNKNIQVEKLSK